MAKNKNEITMASELIDNTMKINMPPTMELQEDTLAEVTQSIHKKYQMMKHRPTQIKNKTKRLWPAMVVKLGVRKSAQEPHFNTGTKYMDTWVQMNNATG